MLLNKNIKILIIILSLITILSIFIYNVYSFTNLYFNYFTTIHCHCDPVGYDYFYTTNTIYADSIDNFKDDLICVQSFQESLGTPVNGYDVTNIKVFKEMFFKGEGKLCIFSPDRIIKVNGIILNNAELHTVHPNLVDYIFELFGINNI
jgi:hypothetical protein